MGNNQSRAESPFMNTLLNDRKASPRIWSAVLFVGGAFVLIALTKMHHAPWAFVGYLIWIAFGVRAAWLPPLRVRRWFWTISAIWHAWCLVPALLFLPLVVRIGGPLGLYPLIGWCITALVVSIWMRGLDSYPDLPKQQAEQGAAGQPATTPRVGD